MKTNKHFLLYSAQFFLEWETFQTNVGEKLKTHISYSIPPFFRKRVIYEKMWEISVELGRP